MCHEQCFLIGEHGSGDFSKRQGMATHIMGEPQEFMNISDVAAKVYTRIDTDIMIQQYLYNIYL